MYIPIVRCFDQGKPNETFFDFIRAGSRLPVELEGDIYSLCACNDAGARRLVEMMDEFEMTSLDRWPSSSSTTRTARRWPKSPGIPRGTYQDEIWSDGYEEPVRLAASMGILAMTASRSISPARPGLSSRGINVPPAYCRAYACFGIKCVVAPEIPNNWASLAPFRMIIPEGCILNAPHPYPVSVRHVIGHLLPDLMMGCLHQAVPDRVTAEGASALWNPPLRGGGVGLRSGARQQAGHRRFRDHHIQLRRHRRASDTGRAERHRLSIRRANHAGRGDRKRRPDHHLAQGTQAGFRRAGRTRGGIGQIMEIATKGDLEFSVNASFDRIAHAPKGREGGRDGAPGRVAQKSGAMLRTKGLQVIPDGERLILELPGGAGMGDPATRDPDLVARDVQGMAWFRRRMRANFTRSR